MSQELAIRVWLHCVFSLCRVYTGRRREQRRKINRGEGREKWGVKEWNAFDASMSAVISWMRWWEEKEKLGWGGEIGGREEQFVICFRKRKRFGAWYLRLICSSLSAHAQTSTQSLLLFFSISKCASVRWADKLLSLTVGIHKIRLLQIKITL